MKGYKKPSRRRWIARFCLGKLIPWKVLVEQPDLKARMKPCKYLINVDAIQRVSVNG